MATFKTVRDRVSNPLSTLRERARHVIDRMRRRKGSRHERPDMPVSPWAGPLFPDPFRLVDDAPLFPAVDVIDEEDTIHVMAELPGLSPEDFKVEVSEGEVFIQGEKKAHREEHGRGYTFTECSYGSFSRIIPLPCEVDKEKAKARFRDGVLDLRIPKHPAARPRHIRVQAG